MSPDQFTFFTIAMTAIISGAICFTSLVRRWFDHRARKIELEIARLQADRPVVANPDPAAPKLEQRVRVLEKIVTDTGAQTAAQIEALRQPLLGAETSDLAR